MKLSQLPKITQRKKKRIGRGFGSGKGGHTVGRGQKGQKSRGKVDILFEGTKMRKSLIKRLPFLRGKGKFKPSRSKPIIINLKYLNILPEGSEVNLQTLIKYNLVKADEAENYDVKILGDGELKKKLTIKLPISKSAAAKIEKAGGKVISVNSGHSVLQKKHPAKAKTKRVVKKTK